MQVSDPTTRGAGAGAVDQLVPGPGRGERSARRPRAGFRKALEPTGANQEGADVPAAPLLWARPEPLRLAPPAAGASAPVRIDRVLLSAAGGAAAGGDAEARIRIGTGVLAGVEIRLTATGGASITARLLTPDAGSRETLSLVMEEIRRRLRGRGIALGLAPAHGRSDGPSYDTDGQADHAPAGWPAVDRERTAR